MISHMKHRHKDIWSKRAPESTLDKFLKGSRKCADLICLTHWMCCCRDTFEPDLALALWVAENLRPLKIVEDSGLKRVFESLLKHCGATTTYKPPSAEAITARLVALKTHTMKKVRCLFDECSL